MRHDRGFVFLSRVRISIYSLIVRRREPLAPLRSSPLEHELSGLGAHAYAKAVRLCAAAVVGLKSPSHVRTLLDKRLRRKD